MLLAVKTATRTRKAADQAANRCTGVCRRFPSWCSPTARSRTTSARRAFEKVIANAFNTWASASCGAGKHPSISAMSGGQTPSSAVEYVQGQPNANIFMFRDDAWMATLPGSALALTTVSYDANTGQIYDADVEVNGTGGNITNGRPTDGADLPSIITHGSRALPRPRSLAQAERHDVHHLQGRLRAICACSTPTMSPACARSIPPQGGYAAGPETVDIVTPPLAGCSVPVGQQAREARGLRSGRRWCWLRCASELATGGGARIVVGWARFVVDREVCGAWRGARGHGVVVPVAVEEVAAVVAFEHVVAIAAVKRVVAQAADQRVVALSRRIGSRSRRD